MHLLQEESHLNLTPGHRVLAVGSGWVLEYCPAQSPHEEYRGLWDPLARGIQPTHMGPRTFACPEVSWAGELRFPLPVRT